jgi:ACR3 family arsenite transporter
MQLFLSGRHRTHEIPVIQTFFIFFLAYGACKLLKLPHDIAAPAGMIGASNFFELAVAVAIALFGLCS